MEKKFRLSLFIFRRDLRLEDNTGLIYALKHSQFVIPVFIFTPEQIDDNPFKSEHCLKFMIESLQDLEEQLNEKGGKLFIFKGKIEEIILKCISKLKIDAIIVNNDYTPYSKKRDLKISELCKKKEISFHSFEDLLLHPPQRTQKKDGHPYQIFTPYFRNASKELIPPPFPNSYTNYFTNHIPFAENPFSLKKMIDEKIDTHLKGGRKAALKILKNLHQFANYKDVRDFPSKDSTTHLSPYLKFTVCSPREVYFAILRELGENHDLIRSLYWRDFFTMIAYFYPHIFKSSFNKKYDAISWSYNEIFFQKWCEGKTGFPIVDAGMREMNATGFMQNRVRMITASLLIKNLHIDWRWGEKYFAQKLIDYDPSVNNGNWQWVASTGCDAQPYFRIFNPWNQQKKFDKECTYIKKWIPELTDTPIEVIHKWNEEKYHLLNKNYPSPIVDYKKTALESINIYKSIH